MKTILILFGIIVTLVIVLLLYVVLSWWNKKQLGKLKLKGELFIKEQKETKEEKEHGKGNTKGIDTGREDMDISDAIAIPRPEGD